MKKQIKPYLATVYVIPYRIANVLYILNLRIGLYIIFEFGLSKNRLITLYTIAHH
jgi:hypothetical protein